MTETRTLPSGLATTLALRDAGEPLPAALYLIAPWVDLTLQQLPAPTPGEAMLSAAWAGDCAARYLAGGDAAAAQRAGVVAALVTGDQAAIERADWDVFRATGVAHLMSISGLHVTMFAWLAAMAVGWCWRKSALWEIGRAHV